MASRAGLWVVGKVRGSVEFVAVVAAPPAKGQDRRDVSAFVCDAEQVCSWFSGSAKGNAFVVTSADDKAQTKVALTGKAATGSVELPGEETGRYRAGDGRATGELTRKAAVGTIELSGDRALRYEADRATATAGLYDLTVRRAGSSAVPRRPAGSPQPTLRPFGPAATLCLARTGPRPPASHR